MKRWSLVAALVGLLLLVMALAACGGDDQDGDSDAADASAATATPTEVPGTPLPTPTLRPAAPRSLPVPQGEPQQFELPFSVGPFVRETLRGNAVSPPTGGQRASYLHPDGGHVQITVFRFQSADQAAQTVESTLTGSSIDEVFGEPYYAPAVSYGIAANKRGETIAAWSRDEWAYIARTSDGRALLDAFLADFPY